MDEFWKRRNKPSAAQLTGALGESVKEYLKKTELPGEKAAVTLNSFYPADAGTLVRTLEGDRRPGKALELAGRAGRGQNGVRRPGRTAAGPKRRAGL